MIRELEESQHHPLQYFAASQSWQDMIEDLVSHFELSEVRLSKELKISRKSVRNIRHGLTLYPSTRTCSHLLNLYLSVSYGLTA